MAVEKIINIKVVDNDLDSLDGKLNKVNKSIEGVEQKSTQTNAKVGKSFDNVGKSADNLKGGVKGIAKEFENVQTAAKAGGAAMRSALISTGIGALVVALGAVIANWDKIKEFVNGVTYSIEEQVDMLKDKQSLLSGEVKNIEKQQKLLELQGLTNESLQEQKIQLIKQEQALNGESIKLLENQIERLKSTQYELTLWEKIVGAVKTVAFGVESGGASVGDVFKEREKAINEFIEKLNKAKGEALDLEIALFKAENPDAGKGSKRDKLTAIDSGSTSEEQQAQAEKESKRFEELFNLKEEQNSALLEQAESVQSSILNNEEIANAQRYENNKKWAELQVEIAEKEFQAKMILLDGISGSLNAVSDIVGRNTAAGKALAVASALIDTYAAIAGQLKAFAGVPIPGYAIAQAIATGLAGFAAVKNILSVKVPGQSGGSSGGNVPQGQQAAPSFNVVGTSGVNQIAQGLAQRNEQPLQAYVVGSNVTTQQSLDRNIVETATIG